MSFDNDNSNKPIITNQVPNKNSNLSTSSFVFGIISLIFVWTIVFPLITSIVGLIFGIKSLADNSDGTTYSIIGIVCSSIALIIDFLIIVVLVLM